MGGFSNIINKICFIQLALVVLTGTALAQDQDEMQVAETIVKGAGAATGLAGNFKPFKTL